MSMANKRSVKPRARKKKKTAKISPKGQFMKVVAGLALLLCLVVTAGLLVNRLLMRPSPPVAAPKPKPIPIAQPKEAAVHHSVPDYEAFHRETVPPPPPITRIKPVTNGIPVAIIIDDIGYDRKMADGFLDLGIPLTFSVLPMGTFNASIVKKARAGNVEIMLHLPMEPDNYPSVNPGPGALLSSMTPDQLIAQLNADLDSIDGVRGVNNHMGSKLTASSEQLRQIFTILKKRDLFFVDSRTSVNTLCRPSAELLQLPFAERDVFIDHEPTREFVKKQLNLLIKRARRQGYAIGIAHPHSVTYRILKEQLPVLKKKIEVVPASQVVHIVN